LTKKQADYLLWKEIIIIQKNKEHFTIKGFFKSLSLKSSLNKGLNFKLKSLYPNILPVPRPNILNPKNINPYWLSGFVAGDGSFMISISKNKNCKTGFQVQPLFNLAQHSKDLKLLKKIKIDFFKDEGKFYNNKTDCRIVFKTLNEINKYLIPHFTNFPLMNRKETEFIIWCQIIKMIQKKEHLTEEGLNLIRKLRNEMR
jgi:hypothetical protein